MRKCFLGGLNFETTEEDLREYFGKYGEITDAVVIRDKITKKSRGFGFVTFKTLASTDQVIQDGRDKAQPGAKSGHNIKGRDIECKRAISREVSHKQIHTISCSWDINSNVYIQVEIFSAVAHLDFLTNSQIFIPPLISK